MLDIEQLRATSDEAARLNKERRNAEARERLRALESEAEEILDAERTFIENEIRNGAANGRREITVVIYEGAGPGSAKIMAWSIIAVELAKQGFGIGTISDSGTYSARSRSFGYSFYLKISW